VVFGDEELAFIILSAIILVIFLVIYHKLYKNPDVSRTHKTVYAAIFPGLIVVGVLAIFIFHIFVDWTDVLKFNIIWAPILLLMLFDAIGHPLVREFPFGRLFLAVGLLVLSMLCLLFINLDILLFLLKGELFDPLPILIILLIVVVPLLILTSRVYGKGEEEFTSGAITSGGRFAFLLLGGCFGIMYLLIGLYTLFSEDHSVPLSTGIPYLILGITLLTYILPQLEKERRKRRDWEIF
jgi:hypothetical protein